MPGGTGDLAMGQGSCSPEIALVTVRKCGCQVAQLSIFREHRKCKLYIKYSSFFKVCNWCLKCKAAWDSGRHGVAHPAGLQRQSAPPQWAWGLRAGCSCLVQCVRGELRVTHIMHGDDSVWAGDAFSSLSRKNVVGLETGPETPALSEWWERCH